MNALTFQNTTFDIVDHKNQPWLRSPQIAVALGYNRADRVNELYARNADEFTDDMTALVKLTDPNGDMQQTRIFSPRGCYALAMFARTATAKEFRKWVLDVLEGKASTQALPHPATLTPAQQQLIQETVTMRCANVPGHMQGKIRAQIYSRLHNKFNVSKYDQLPAIQIDDVIAYLETMRLQLPGEFQAQPAPTLTLPANGRFLVVVENGQATTLDATGMNLMPANQARSLRHDVATVVNALDELRERLKVIDGIGSPRLLDVPLQVAMR
jgi:prophage antirepressor-like protein